MPYRIDPEAPFYPIWIAVSLMVGAFAYWSGMHELTTSPTANACVEAIEQLWAIRNNTLAWKVKSFTLASFPKSTSTARFSRLIDGASFQTTRQIGQYFANVS